MAEITKSALINEITENVTKTFEEKLKGIEDNIAKGNEIQRKYVNIGGKEVNEKPLAKGHGFVRMVKLAHRGKNDPQKMVYEAEKAYSHDKSFMNSVKSILKTDGNNATFPSEGGYLVQEQYAQEIIELLRAKVFLFQAGARRIPMPKGNLNMPVHTAGGLSFFVGEGAPAIPNKQGVGNIKLTSKKQVSMVLITDELLMDNSYNADQAFLEDMLNEMATVLNFTALYGSGTQFTPLGLKNNPDVPTDTFGALVSVALPATIKGEIMKTNVPKSNLAGVWNGILWSQFYNLTDGNGAFIYRDEMNQGKLVGDPFHMFNDVEVGTTGNNVTDYFYGDWSEFIVGEQSMFNVETSKEATIEDSLGNKINLFQNGWTAIKVTSFYDFALRHPEAFTVFTGIFTV